MTVLYTDKIQPDQDMVTAQVAAANRLVQRADAFCLNDPTCPFHGQGNGSVVKAWQTVLTMAEQAPLSALNCGPGKGCNSPVTARDLQQGAAVLFNTIPDFPLFNIGLNASLNGDASIFAYQPDVDIRDTVFSPLLCSDVSKSFIRGILHQTRLFPFRIRRQPEDIRWFQ